MPQGLSWHVLGGLFFLSARGIRLEAGLGMLGGLSRKDLLSETLQQRHQDSNGSSRGHPEASSAPIQRKGNSSFGRNFLGVLAND